MSSQRRSLVRSCISAGIVVSLTCAAGIAWSHSNGITGASGKQGGICNQCHDNPKTTPTPTVTLDGPMTLDAGASAIYTFKIETTAQATGMNAATSDGTLAAADGGLTQFEDDEVTHLTPNKADAGSVIYSFFLTAPAYGGPVKLYAAGNAVDLDNSTDGDQSARTTLDITINGPPRPDAGTPPPATTTPAPPTTAPKPTVDAGAGGSDPVGAAPAASDAAPADSSGCSMGPADRASVPGGAIFASLIALAALGRKRRRR
jgi:MYXO-CTERM domain-containing protein